MAKQFSELSKRWIQFIAEQKLFFVGTATDAGRVNISPKGMDSLRVINNNRVAWLNVTGSGNETSAHVQSYDDYVLRILAVPDFEYVEDRTLPSDWAINKCDEGIRLYWKEKNQQSIDGIPTRIVEKNS